MSASPSNLTITAGSMGFSTVSVTSLNGFAGNVTLSTSAPPVGFGVGISPFILTLRGNGTAQAHVNVNDNFNGTTTWFLNIIGSSGSLSHSTTIQINGEPFIAPTFAISAANPFVVAQGFSNSTTVVVSSQHNFNGTVSLTASVFPNVSGGPTLTLSPTQVTVPPGGSGTSTLTVSTSLATPIGFYNYTLTGSAPQGGGFITAQFNGALTVEASTLSGFTISANPSSQNVPAGANATSTILLSSVNGFSGTINLSTSPPPLCASCPNWGVTPTKVVLSSGGRANATLTFFTVLGSPPNTYTVTVTGASGGLSHSVNVAFTIVSTKPDFSISANPLSQNVPAGANATSTILLASINGFSGTITLSTSAPPLCASCPSWRIVPTQVGLPSGGQASATLVFFTVQGSPATTYTVTVTGASGGLSHSVNVAFTIISSKPDFSISANPTTVVLPSGGKGNSTITLTSFNGFNGTVTLHTSPSPLCPTPRCTVWSITPTSVNLTPEGRGFATLNIVVRSASVTLTVSTSNSTTPGNYSVTVTGASGTSSHTVQVGILVNSRTTGDFSISANPSSLTILRGSSATSTLTVTSLNGFAGTVSMFAMASPPGLSMSLNPANVTLQSGGTANSIFSVFTTNGTGLGTYQVTVTGFSPGLSRSVTLAVTVTSPPPPPAFTLTVSPTNQTIRRGSTATYTITVKGTNGFNGTVTLSATVSPVNRHAPILSLPRSE